MRTDNQTDKKRKGRKPNIHFFFFGVGLHGFVFLYGSITKFYINLTSITVYGISVSGLLKNKLALIAIGLIAVVVVGVTVGLSLNNPSGSENNLNPTTPSTSNDDNPIALGSDYGLTISVMDNNPVISKSEETVDIQVMVQRWSDGQDRNTETPHGAPAANLQIELTTSMGFFKYNQNVKYQEETDETGRVIVPLSGGQIPGVATVTAKALDGSGIAASLRVYITKVNLAPVEVVVNKNEQISFECQVQGIDDPDLLSFKWRNYNVTGYMKPLGSDYCYQNNVYTASKSPILAWQRYDGRGFEGYVEVEAFLFNDLTNKEISLGKAQAKIHLQQYYVQCGLVGRVTRGANYVDVAYGVLIPKVDGAVGYSVRGSGFNDQLFYGSNYGSGYQKIENLKAEQGGYFLAITSGTSNSAEAIAKSDTELLDDYVKRFQGGDFYASPTFGGIP